MVCLVIDGLWGDWWFVSVGEKNLKSYGVEELGIFEGLRDLVMKVAI